MSSPVLDAPDSSPALSEKNILPNPNASQSISIKLPAAKSSFAVKVLGLTFWALIAYLLCQLIILYANNQPIVQWWQKGTGPGKHYNEYFSIWLCLCQKQASTLLFYIIWMFIPQNAHMSSAQIDFTLGTLFRFMRVDLQGVQQGILIPRHLASSILLREDDDDVSFMDWCKKNKTKRIWNPKDACDPQFVMTVKSATPTSNNATIYVWGPPTKNSIDPRIGIYPDAKDTEGWKCCCQYWMNGEVADPKWLWTNTETSTGAKLQILQVNPPDPTAKNEWWDLDKHPDNVFARYGISYDSPAIIYYTNKKYADGSMPVDAISMMNLIAGADGDDGGWAYFMHGLGDTVSKDVIFSQLYTEVNFKVAPPQPSCGSKVGGAVLAGAGSFFGALGGLAFLGAAAFTGPGFFLGGMALVSAGITGYQQYSSASNSCA